jgi:hypothetical protein
MTVKRAVDAYRARDYDTLASLVTPLLPALPNDGAPRSDCALRRAFASVIDSAEFPAHLENVADRYLREASDAQLLTLADMIIHVGGILRDARGDKC